VEALNEGLLKVNREEKGDDAKGMEGTRLRGKE